MLAEQILLLPEDHYKRLELIRQKLLAIPADKVTKRCAGGCIESLCWKCANAYAGKCRWVDEFEAVWDKAARDELSDSVREAA